MCVPKLYGILYARSIKNALEIEIVFDIPYRNVKWDSATLEEKMDFATILIARYQE